MRHGRSSNRQCKRRSSHLGAEGDQRQPGAMDTHSAVWIVDHFFHRRRDHRMTLAVSATTRQLPFAVAGFPVRSWAFAVRIWLAAVVALLASFWLQLGAPTSAMLTVMILAEPTRGQALEKAG